MDAIKPYLPPSPGILPYWLLLTSAASIYNAIQNYFIIWQTKEIYSKKSEEVTPLAGRLFAAWTGIAAVVRFLGAYHLNDKTTYYLVIATYGIALWHFTSEWLIFGSIKVNRASIGPLVVANVSMIWCLTQMDYYLK